MSTDKADITGGKIAGEKRTFRTVETAFFQFEKVGDSVEGFLVSKTTQRMRPNSDGSPNFIGRYKLQIDGDAGEPQYVEFLGGTDIDAKLGDVDESEYIRVTRSGSQRTTSGNSMNLYTVEVAD